MRDISSSWSLNEGAIGARSPERSVPEFARWFVVDEGSIEEKISLNALRSVTDNVCLCLRMVDCPSCELVALPAVLELDDELGEEADNLAELDSLSPPLSATVP